MSFTFLGEKLSAVLPGSDHFAWDLPKELHDQSDVVCPPPHTSQREQARFSITACTHTSTHTYTGCMRLTHTIASRIMDTITDRRPEVQRHNFQFSNNTSNLMQNQNPRQHFVWFCAEIQVVSRLSVSVHFCPSRHLCIPASPALWPALPLRLKNSREYFPESAKCLGIQPSSSMMWAMWSTEDRGG